MKSCSLPLSGKVILVLILWLPFLFSGCMIDGQGHSRGQAGIHYARLKQEKEQLAERIIELKEQRHGQDELLDRQDNLIADLQLGLLQKHARVNELLIKNKQLVSEFVRYNVEMKGQDSKVEAVRLLAEGAAVIEMARQKHDDKKSERFLAVAENYLNKGDAELKSNNYEGASYLAYQAIDIVRSLDQKDDQVEQINESEEITFVLHLPMKVLRDSNVRENPTNKSGVLYVEKKGELVSAVGLKGQWVKVADKQHGSGWIHYSLLSGLIN